MHILEPLTEKSTDELKKRVGTAQIADAGYDLRLVGGHDKTPLARLPVFSVFHRQNASAGVPASFAAFIKAYPALRTSEKERWS